MSYATTCRFAALTCFALFVGYFFFPSAIISTFGVENGPAGEFMAGRAGIFLLGLAVLGWFGAQIADPDSRKPLCLSFMVAMTAMAILGAWEYYRGNAGVGILAGVAVEALFALLFVRQFRQHVR